MNSALLFLLHFATFLTTAQATNLHQALAPPSVMPSLLESSQIVTASAPSQSSSSTVSAPRDVDEGLYSSSVVSTGAQLGNLKSKPSSSLRPLVPTSSTPDLDELTQHPDDTHMQYLLMSTYNSTIAGTGKVWVVPTAHPNKGFLLLAGLDSPSALCYDDVNDYLYVIDVSVDGTGYIYQYEIDRDEDEFELKTAEYSVIYEGTPLSDCALDEYGNLYFSDPVHSQVNFVSYLDLWSGFRNQFTILYSGQIENVSMPEALDVASDLHVFWTNSDLTSSVLTAEAQGRLSLGQVPTELLNYSTHKGLGLAVSQAYVYQALNDGSVLAISRENKGEVHIKVPGLITNPRSLCVCGGALFIADATDGTIYFLLDDGEPELPLVYLHVPDLSYIDCIPTSSGLSPLLWGLVFVLVIV